MISDDELNTIMLDDSDGKHQPVYPACTPENYENRIDYFWEHLTEIGILSVAEDGNLAPLAELIQKEGLLRTFEARKFVADRLKGVPVQSGRKRKNTQIIKDLMILMYIRGFQKERSLSEYAAVKRYLELYPSSSEETVKSALKRIKKMLSEAGIAEYLK